MFAERYVNAVNSSDLRDDAHHVATMPLMASVRADQSGGDDSLLGSLLCRVKYADGAARKLFEAGTANLAALLRVWLAAVTEKGKARKWVTIRSERDIITAHTLYKRVAEQSLAYWLDDRCEACQGARQTPDRRVCTCCAGTGRAEIEAGKFESDKIKDMVSELQGIHVAHSARAARELRRVA
jgi:hypothetical protein